MRRRTKAAALAAAATAAAVAVALVAFVVVSWLAVDWDPAPSLRFPAGSILRDSSGSILRVSLGPGDIDCRPCYVPSPDHWIVKALVAAEDGTFFSHCGARPWSMLRAFWQNAVSGRRVSGASTLTMQTVRLISPHQKSYFEKWIETLRALKMERERSKLWILGQYLNRAPFGSNFIGIEAAANGWFGKSAADLGLGEAALLAGMVQAPSRLRPDRHPQRAMRRREYVLRRMVEEGFATPEQAAAAATVAPALRRAPRPFAAPWYCDWFAARLRRQAAGRDAPQEIDVATPLVPEIQALCENAVAETAAADGLRAAVAVVRVRTGEVVAIAADGDYFSGDAGQVNPAAAPRSAGSSLKPLLAALALDLGLAVPDERLPDVRVPYNGFSPANFDGRCRGLASLSDSLVLSLNIPFVNLLSRTGTGRFADLLRASGFSHIPDDVSSLGLGLAIGNAETTLVELACAYALFARAAAGDAPGAPFSREAAFVVSEMLSGPQRSAAALGHSAAAEIPRFAWKTGTSSAYRDAWCVLWNPEWAVAVWRGRLSGGFGDTSVTGAKAAAPCAWRIARALAPRGAGTWFQTPPKVLRRRVCAVSGLPPNAVCPETVEGSLLEGRAEGRVCQVHRTGFNGKLETRFDPAVEAFFGRAGAASALAIAFPADGATFRLDPAAPKREIACAAAGVPANAKVWWFLDGLPAGSTEGRATLALPVSPGRHLLSCTTAEGVSAEASFSVVQDASTSAPSAVPR